MYRLKPARRQRGLAALAPEQAGPRGRACPGRVEGAEEQLLDGGDELLRRVLGWAHVVEILAEAHMAVEGFLGADSELRSGHLVVHGLGAEPANPPA